MASTSQQGCSSEETYKFQLVEFITRGPKKGNKKAIDVVPSSWVSYDEKKGKIRAKFIKPPYKNEDIDLLYTLVETEVIPPEDWPTYSVKIRGRAKTYNEALRRLKMLENEEYAFTTDTDGDPQTTARKIEQQFKTKKLIVSEETQRAMLVPSIDAGDPNFEIENLEDSSSSDENLSAGCTRKRKLKRLSSPKLKCRTENRSNKLPKLNSINTNISTIALSGKPSFCHQQSSVNHEKPIKKQCTSDVSTSGNIDADKSINLTVDESPSVNEDLQKKSEIHLKKKTEKKPKSGKSDTVLILSILKGMAVDLKELNANQQILMQQLPSTSTDVPSRNFISKYNLNLPFQTMNDFDEFNKNLTIMDEYRTEFTSSLHSYVDRELCLIKSCTNVLRKYLSRNVIIQFTSKRKMPGKFLITSSMFYDCILNVMTQTHKDVLSGRAITEQTFLSTIGKVFSNAKDWDGQRNKRIKQDNEDQRQDLDNEELIEYVEQRENNETSSDHEIEEKNFVRRSACITR